MANSLGQPSDVVSGADKMMLHIIEEAEGLPLDKRLAVMQAATRWVAVKNRLNMPEERNGFDEFREQLSGGAGSGPAGAASAPGGERANSAGSEKALIRRAGAPRYKRPGTASPRSGANSAANRPTH